MLLMGGFPKRATVMGPWSQEIQEIDVFVLSEEFVFMVQNQSRVVS
jgi:hypothetical protein